MKYIIFSDIHGNYEALLIMLNQIKTIEYDKIIFCGDIFGYYYEQDKVIDTLQNISNLIWIKGNHDQYFVDAFFQPSMETELITRYGHSYDKLSRFSNDILELVQCLPSMIELEDNGKKIGIFHGTPKDSLEGRLYPDNEIENLGDYDKYNVVIQGHTHCQMKRIIGNTLIINPGSVGQPRDGKNHCYVIFDSEAMSVEYHTFKMNYEKLYEEIDKRDPGLTKLKEVLERGNEKNISDCN